MTNIGVIDSGVGGLTVLFDVIKSFPNCNYFYIGDSKNCPYGKRNIEDIKKLSFNMVNYLVKIKKIDILVIACNSISSNASDYLRSCFKDLIIIETVEPTTNYIKCLDCRKIGLIATQATIKSKMYESKLQNYEVISKACPTFVDIVENINISSDEKDEIVKHELKDIINQDIDTLILGCTHFPLLTNSITKIFDGKIINSSKAIIIELEKYINKNNNIEGSVEINTTGNNTEFENQIKVMFNKNYKVNQIEIW